MKEIIGVIAIVFAVIATPMFITWGVGAFVTWDAAWAFGASEDRIKFLLTSFIVLIVLAVCVVQ